MDNKEFKAIKDHWKKLGDFYRKHKSTIEQVLQDPVLGKEIVKNLLGSDETKES